MAAFAEQLVQTIEFAGCRLGAVSTILPLQALLQTIRSASRDGPRYEEDDSRRHQAVSGDYFRALRLILQGRAISERMAGSSGVAVINPEPGAGVLRRERTRLESG